MDLEFNGEYITAEGEGVGQSSAGRGESTPGAVSQ